MIFEIVAGILFLLLVISILVSLRYPEFKSSLVVGAGSLLLTGLIVMAAIGVERQVDIEAREFCEEQGFSDYDWDDYDLVCQNFSNDKVLEKGFVKRNGKFYESAES